MSTWPLFTTRGPRREADILLDTCFSTSDFDNFDDFVSQDHSLPSMSNPAKPTDMQNHEFVVEML